MAICVLAVLVTAHWHERKNCPSCSVRTVRSTTRSVASAILSLGRAPLQRSDRGERLRRDHRLSITRSAHRSRAAIDERLRLHPAARVHLYFPSLLPPHLLLHVEIHSKGFDLINTESTATTNRPGRQQQTQPG